jgi:ankyrin repeat protein
VTNVAALTPEALLFSDLPEAFVAWLNSPGADGNVTSDDGETPLWVRAVQRAHTIGFALLHERGINFNIGTPFLKKSGHEALLVLLLSQIGALTTLVRALASGINPNALFSMATAETVDLRSRTVARGHVQSPVLHILVESGNVAACSILLANGAGINVVDSEGNSALHKALVRPIIRKEVGCPMRELLIRYHPDFELLNNQGYTPASYSVAYFTAVMPESVDENFLNSLRAVSPC